MDGIAVFTPDHGSPLYQMSTACFDLIKSMINQTVTGQLDAIAKDVAREILRNVEDIAATGQIDSASEICEFLRGYYGLNE